MSFEDERKAVESRFAAQWTTTPIRWENVPFEELSVPYVALHILTGDGQQVSLGTAPRHRFAGVIVVQIFVPEQTGTALAKQYADTIATIWRNQEIVAGTNGLIRCRTPSIQTVGVAHGWHQTNVNAPYQRDKIY